MSEEKNSQEEMKEAVLNEVEEINRFKRKGEERAQESFKKWAEEHKK